MAGKGRSKESYTVDCIDPKLGYIEGNIQCLLKSENSSKGTKVLHYDWHSKTATVIENFRQKETEDLPF